MYTSFSQQALCDGHAKQLPRACRARACERLEGLPAGARHHCRDVRKIRRLVAARGWPRAEIAWQQIGAVGLEQQPASGDGAHERHQVSPTAFVADPAGDTDGEPELEVGFELRGAAREAVRDACVAGAMLA